MKSFGRPDYLLIKRIYKVVILDIRLLQAIPSVEFVTERYILMAQRLLGIGPYPKKSE